jgi:hypothetical protein
MEILGWKSYDWMMADVANSVSHNRTFACHGKSDEEKPLHGLPNIILE